MERWWRSAGDRYGVPGGVGSENQKCAPLSGGALHPNDAALEPDELAGDRQSEPAAARLACATVVVSPIEALEDVRQVLGGDPGDGDAVGVEVEGEGTVLEARRGGGRASGAA